MQFLNNFVIHLFVITTVAILCDEIGVHDSSYDGQQITGSRDGTLKYFIH